MTRPATRRRDKLAPDPDVRRAILVAASESVREQGVRGLSIAAVLEHAQLSTRAFYRHFESKDQLVAAVFLEMARVEMRRLKRKMFKAANPVDAVAAWIDGRLDLAFEQNIRSDLRQLSLEAQSQMFASPELKEFSGLVARGAGPTHSAFLSSFFTLVGCHGVHVTAGLLWLGTMMAQFYAKGFRRDIRHRFLCFSLFWHALDIIWVGIFSLVYLVGTLPRELLP